MKIVKKLVISVLTLLVCVSVLPVGNVSALTLTNSKYAKTNTRYRGSLGYRDSMAYRISLDKAKKIKITFNANGDDCNLGGLRLYNASGDQIWSTSIEENDKIGSKTTIYTHYLTKGTYYIVIDNEYGYSYYHGGNYYWQYSATTLNRISQGIHNNVNSSAQFQLGKDNFDILGVSNEKNVLKFNITKPGYYQLYGFTACDNPISYEVYDANGDIKYEDYASNDNPIGRTSFAKKMRLSKGNYYLVLSNYYYSGYPNGIIKFRVRKI